MRGNQSAGAGGFNMTSGSTFMPSMPNNAMYMPPPQGNMGMQMPPPNPGFTPGAGNSMPTPMQLNQASNGMPAQSMLKNDT